MSSYNCLRDANIDLVAKLDFQPCQMKTCFKLNLALSERLFSFFSSHILHGLWNDKNKSIKDRYPQLAHTLYLPLLCAHGTREATPRQTPVVPWVMNDTVVSDQSGWEEPCRSEVLPSTVAQQYNGASVTLWLRLGCSRYSWAVSSASPLLFIHPAHCRCSLMQKKQAHTCYSPPCHCSV